MLLTKAKMFEVVGVSCNSNGCPEIKKLYVSVKAKQFRQFFNTLLFYMQLQKSLQKLFPGLQMSNHVALLECI